MRSYLRAANIGWSGLLLDDVKSMNFTDAEMNIFRLEPGDILLNEASGSPGEVGKPAIWSGEIEDCAFQNTLLRVRSGPEISPRYLLHYFRHQAATAAFARGSRGVGINHLGREMLANWRVPLPPLDEQRRIVSVLDRVHAIGCRRSEIEHALSMVEAALFASTFAKGDRWSTAKLGELIVNSQIGLVRSSKDIASVHPYGYVRMDAITSKGRFVPKEGDRTHASEMELEKYSAKGGDLLFNTRNTRELVGKSAVFRGPPRLINNNILRIRLDTERVLPEYVHAYLWSPEGRRELARRKSGTTSVFAIYEKQLVTTDVPVPPLALQRDFAGVLAALGRQQAAATQQHRQVEELFTSLQHRAFSGQL